MQAPLTLLRAAFVRQPFRLGQGVVVMGWSGLTLVLMRVQALSSARVGGLTQTLVWLSAGVASGVLVLLLLALAAQTALRFFSRPSPLGESELALERRRIPSLSASAALAVGMILLASVWFQLGYPSASGLLWCLGASLEALTSGVVFCRLFQARGQEGFWAQITPTWLIPAVGNALVVLAGVPLGFTVWSALQFVLGCACWPVVSRLLTRRLERLGPLPLAVLPTWCIVLSPPSVVGLGLLVWRQEMVGGQGQAFWAWTAGAWGCWLVASLSLWQLKAQARAILSASFGMPHWALSFPLAAYASLTWALLAGLLTAVMASPATPHLPWGFMMAAMTTAMTTVMWTVMCAVMWLWSSLLLFGVLAILLTLSVKTLQLLHQSWRALEQTLGLGAH